MMMNWKLPFGQAVLQGTVTRAALITAYADTFFLMLFLALPAFIVLLLMPKPEMTIRATPPEAELID